MLFAASSYLIATGIRPDVGGFADFGRICKRGTCSGLGRRASELRDALLLGKKSTYACSDPRGINPIDKESFQGGKEATSLFSLVAIAFETNLFHGAEAGSLDDATRHLRHDSNPFSSSSITIMKNKKQKSASGIHLLIKKMYIRIPLRACSPDFVVSRQMVEAKLRLGHSN